MHSKIDLQVVFENGKFLVFFRKNLKKKCMVLHFHQFYNGLNVLWFYLHAFSIKVNFLVVRKLVKVAKASRFFFLQFERLPESTEIKHQKNNQNYSQITTFAVGPTNP